MTFISLIVNASSEARTGRQGCVANKAVFASSNRAIFSRLGPRGFSRARVQVWKSVLSVPSASRTRGCRGVGWDQVYRRFEPGSRPPRSTVGVYHRRTFPRPHFLYLRTSFSQNYRQGSYQASFDLYNDLLDSAETVRLDTFHSSYSFEIQPKHVHSNPMSKQIFSQTSKLPKSTWNLSIPVIYTL